MQRLRRFLLRTQAIWLSVMVSTLLIVLSSQLHIHIHTESSYGHGGIAQQVQNRYQHDLNEADWGSSHHASGHNPVHSAEQHHSGIEITVVNIFPDGLGKYISLLLLAIALFATVILILSPHLQVQRLSRRNDDVPLMRWRVNLSPQLRAPPL